MGAAECACFIKIIFWQQICIKPRNQIKTIIINREKVYIVFIQIGQLPFQFFETWKSDGVAVLFSAKKTFSVFVTRMMLLLSGATGLYSL